MFEGFEQARERTREAEINFVYGGEGPPVLLLHGYPQTHAMWHRGPPRLTEKFTVVVADLRGYGDSSKLEGDAEHETYSKRAMAEDQVQAMEALDFDSFAVVGHDRGARVAHRMTLDHPDHVSELAVLDIVPTREVFVAVGKDLATAYYHWFFLIQPYDLSERLIGAAPIYYLHKKPGGWGTDLQMFAPEALAEYERCFNDPRTIHASCEDYRAAASIDLVHDEADAKRGRKIECPLLALWGARSVVERHHDVKGVWRGYARNVQGHSLETGHLLVGERPEETARELVAFLGDTVS